MAPIPCSTIPHIDKTKRASFPSYSAFTSDGFEDTIIECKNGNCMCLFPFVYKGASHWGCIGDALAIFCCTADFNPGDCAVSVPCASTCPISMVESRVPTNDMDYNVDVGEVVLTTKPITRMKLEADGCSLRVGFVVVRTFHEFEQAFLTMMLKGMINTSIVGS